MTHALRSLILALALMSMTATALAQQPQPAAGGDALQWISVVLLAGQTQEAPGGTDEIPAAVQEALAEVRDFLPFRHFRMYDAALIRPPRAAGTNAWLRGTGTQVVEATLMLAPGTNPQALTKGPFPLYFRLREPGDNVSKSTGDRTLMSANVTVALGETVVVGTSRLRGDTALIVLLTAVPAKR